MLYYSTNKKSTEVDFKTAVLKGLPEDNGLYMPKQIPELPSGFINSLPTLTFQEISFQVASAFISDDLSEDNLRTIINEAFNFDAPLVELDNNLFSFELFHGPTLAFKDFAARFMAKLMGFYVEQSGKELTILVATSGDTGSAVASGFLNVPGIQVFLLYPSNKVSHIQEQQLTTFGNNITSLEIEGTFDDCQKITKQAFLDSELNKRFTLTSANSINVARLIPQSFYYFYAYAQARITNSEPIIISVPCGNLGNITSGLLAKHMGLPIKKYVLSSNVNDVVLKYLKTGTFSPAASIKTISNAMDVGNPSNFVRIQALCNSSVENLRKDVSGFSFNDSQTINAIRDVYKKYNYVMDPHGAVGYLGLQNYLQQINEMSNGIFIETAHPAKFLDSVEDAISTEVEMPDRLESVLHKEKKVVKLSASLSSFKEFLLSI
ncbi:MAG: threonine synthase [Ignavibacteria bacterium]|nr:threonine synthase [Ignavibacteria bacterium]